MWNQKVRTKHLPVVLLVLAGMLGWLPKHASAERSGVAARSRAAKAYGKLPLRFEPNEGQSGGQVKFLSRGRGYTLFLTSSGAVLALKKSDKPSGDAATLRMRLLGANSNAQATGVEKLAGTVSYFIGNDPKKWRTNVPTYGKVEYRNIYPGVDLLYYGNQQQLEYDLVVAPGADPGVARLGISGARKIQLDPSGDLVLQTLGGAVRLRKPVAYQRTANGQQSIDVRYALGGAGEVSFVAGAYDHSKPLVIDPVLVYSTFLGGSLYEDEEFNGGIAVDSTGSAYVTGSTQSTNFPTVDPFQPSKGGAWNAFVTKVNPEGTAFVYSTYLGGSGQDFGTAIAVDSSGNAYVTGLTGSFNFPTTPSAFQTAKPSVSVNTAAFVTELNSTGSALLYSTYLGGSSSDYGYAIAVDSSGRASVTGQAHSPNFPITPGAPQTLLNGTTNPFVTAPDAFVTTLAAGGGSLVFSTYLGGSSSEQGAGIALDSSGNIYVTGVTASFNDFPLVNPLQAAFGGDQDAFVAKYNPNTSTLVYSTYLGGSGFDFGLGIAVDSAGSAYVAGRTQSTNFPTANPFQATLRGGPGVSDGVFVSKLNPAGSTLVYSTYLGGGSSGGNDDIAYGIAVDSTGAAYLTGITASGNFPLVDSFQPINKSFGGPFVTKLNPAGSALVYSTYLGGFGTGTGIAVDASDNAYATGYVYYTEPFTTTPGAAQPSNGGQDDAFVVKIASKASSSAAVTSSVNPSVFGEEVTFTATVSPGSANSNTPTGTVTFLDGSATLGTEALTNGTAVFDTISLSTGSHSITVSYGGDANFAPSTSTILIQVVDQAATTTTLISSQNPSTFGQNVTFTATVAAVSPGAGSPTGTVTFKDGTAAIGTGTVSAGVATFSTSALGAGSHTITASYSGDANFIASASTGLAQSVILPAAVILINESIKVTDAPLLMAQAIAVIVDNESITVTDVPGFGPISVSSLVSVTSTGLVYSRVTRTFSGTLTVLNTSGQSIAGPIEIVLTNLTAGVTLLNATGTTAGNSYVTVLPSGSLAPGQSANIAIRFGDPSNALIHFTPIAYSGGLN
jgi:hypothetical protein